ncbi:hypothetical protein PVK06_008618 [Gossypium arboreum]|uniref:Reverse transcriptase n=1 Tax=Gossypium arboreum TaxID=29729 RepID=A0ABR0QLA0_GOSAR|nr:hypothetical protein PVK06_008618 [Gossypium arboreum]
MWEKFSGDLLQKLENLKRGLRQWAGQLKVNRKKRKEVLMEKLAKLAEAERDDKNLAELIDTKIHLNFEIEKNECYWERRARLNWLKFGDKNTTFFHCQATQRRRTNFIHKLKNEDGRVMAALQEIEVVARSYFQNLFSAGDRGNYDHLMTGIDCCVYEEDNKKTDSNIHKRGNLRSNVCIGSKKAAGKDGFPALFYHKCWHIVGEEVTSFVHSF